MPTEIDVAQLAEVRKGPHVLIDVREPEEYVDAHVPGAVLIPLGQIADRAGEIPGGSDLFVICRSGARSERAAEILATKDRIATNIAGGTLAWINAGNATVSGDQPD